MKILSMRSYIKNISIVEDFVILFLFVFDLTLPIVSTSSLALFVLLPLRLFFSTRAINYTFSFFVKKYILGILGIYLLIFCHSIFSTLINLRFDLSLLPTYVNVILHFITSVMIIALFKCKNRSFEYVRNMFISIFVMQSIIQIIAFFIPQLREFVQLFQSDATIEKSLTYGNKRGLALSGSVFFSLASIYGLIFIFFIHKVIEGSRLSNKSLLLFVVILIGGFFTGRTYFIGIAVAGMYYLLSSVTFLTKFNVIIRIICLLSFGAFAIWYSLPDNLQNQVFSLIEFAFEFLFNYANSGSLSTNSTDTLGTMYFDISPKTLLLGDGLYTGPDGAYYMHTDAGYMRNILLSGIVGLLLNILFDVYLLFGHLKLKNKCFFKFSIFIFSYLAILHVKGEAFAYLIMIHSCLFVYYLAYIYLIKDKA